jgi:hypothetical protein
VQTLAKGVFKIIPVFLYALGEHPLSNENMEELRNLKETYPYNPVLFVSTLTHIIFDNLDEDLTKSEQHGLHSKTESCESTSTKEDSMKLTSVQDNSTKLNCMKLNSLKEIDNGLNLEKINSLGLIWLHQLIDLGFINESININQSTWLTCDKNSQSNDLLDSRKNLGKYNLTINIILNFLNIKIHRCIYENENLLILLKIKKVYIILFTDRILYFVRNCLQTYLVNVSNHLNDVHTTSLRKFILSAFDMAREIQITPKRIQYAQQKEAELYANLMKVVNAKQEELTELIHKIIQEMKDEILLAPDNLNLYHNIPLNDEESGKWSATVRMATTEVQRLVLTRLGERVAKQLATSVNCLRDTFVGTLQRCLLSLEKSYEQDTSLTGNDNSSAM